MIMKLKRLNNYESAQNSFKTEKGGTQKLFTDIIYRMIMI